MQGRVKLAAVMAACLGAATIAVGAAGGAAADDSLAPGEHQLATDMTGAEQAATGTAADPDGVGKAKLRLRPLAAEVCFEISHRDIAPSQAAHVHKAPPGQNNLAIAVNLYTHPGVASSISGCVPADPVTIDDIIANPTAYYVQVHNTEFVQGAIRGQLGD